MGDDSRDYVEQYAQLALRAGFTINGGAALALLAFVGTVWPPKSEMGFVEVTVVNSLTCGITFFAFGVLSAALSTLFAYGARYQYTYGQKENPGINDYHRVALIAGGFSFLLFIGGVLSSTQAIQEYLSPS